MSPGVSGGGVTYTCPMHPEVVRDEPGSCPECGMALEARAATAEEPPNPELADMTRRAWVGAIVGVPGVRAGDGRDDRRPGGRCP